MTGEQELFHIGEDLYQKEEKGYIFDKSQKMMKENLIVDTFQSKVRSVVSMGIGAVKTDFSEAVPEDAVYFDGSTGIQGHNKLTFLYAKTIYDIMAEVKIPLLLLEMLMVRM